MKITVLLIVVLCTIYIADSTTVKPAHHISKHVAVDSQHSKQGKHVENKAHKKSGKDAKHHVETANKGQHGSISHKIADEEKALKKTTSMSEGNHQSHKKAAAHQEHAAKHAEAAKHKKTNVLKGFHEKYHKNEHKQHDSFYSHAKKSGDWKTYGMKRSKFDNEKFDKNELKKKIALKSLEKNGKATKKASGHKVEEHKAYKGDKSKKQAHDKLIKFGKKHQKPEDKHKYKYSQVLH
ncbi:transcription elongation factor B polypeptide 3-like [Atheta coriaria]|uniref:transcription elongation factor B polypeptide 3-like n=1 Tax=Dalotia coriaria TaxID=877792 RepID=UPI0031F455DB